MELADVLDDAALRDLASSFGVDSRDLAILYDGRNRVYSVAAGEPRVLKVIPSWVEEPALAEAEVDWVAWLHRRGAPVVRPYPTRQGGWVARATSEGVELSACLMERLRGDPMEGRGWTPPLIEDLGAVMGRLHALTRDYVPGVGAPRRPEWYEKDWLARPEKTLHPSQAAVIERCHRLRDALMQLPRDGDAYGLIHDDLHTGNLWTRDGRITVLDLSAATRHGWSATSPRRSCSPSGRSPRPMRIAQPSSRALFSGTSWWGTAANTTSMRIGCAACPCYSSSARCRSMSRHRTPAGT